MQSPLVCNLRAAEADANDRHDDAVELALLRDVLRMLPAGVTVLDENGRLLLVNDAAATELGIPEAGSAGPSAQWSQRRDAALELLRAGQVVVTEETVGEGQARKVLLTTHRPVCVADRPLLISSSADISAQKTFEDQLFRSAYYDELTDLPSRRVIEHRVNSLTRDGGDNKFALAFLDIDNFKHINDYYGHSVGDGILVELARRLGRELRESDMLSRISGDEFLLLLNPIRSAEEVTEFIQSTLKRLSAPFFIDGSEIFASTSIGVSLYPDHGNSYKRCCARTRILRCTASRTTARALLPSSTPPWSTKRWRA